MTKYRIKEYKGKFTVQEYVKPKFVDIIVKYFFCIGYNGWKDLISVRYLFNFTYATFSTLEEAQQEIDKIIEEEQKETTKPRYHYYPEETK